MVFKFFFYRVLEIGSILCCLSVFIISTTRYNSRYILLHIDILQNPNTVDMKYKEQFFYLKSHFFKSINFSTIYYK